MKSVFQSMIFLFLFIFCSNENLSAQQPPIVPAAADTLKPGTDTGKIVRLLRADKYRLVKTNDTTELHILTGNVLMQQGKTIFSCDSAIQDKILNQVEAFGNIHINDADSIHTYSQYLKYLGNTRVAYLKKNVKLTDGKGVLTTNELEYDLNSKTGTYFNGGKVVNGKSVLTSREGFYYADTREVYFKKNVRLVDPEYTMATDTLLYSIENEMATFVAPTTIRDGQSVIKTSSGFYDLRNGNASFGERPIIEDSTQQIIADNINYDKKTGEGIAAGNVLYRDTAQGATILAGATRFNSNTKDVVATEKPVMILEQNGDSLYIAADTLYSAMMADSISVYTDSAVKTDSLVAKKDSLPTIVSDTSLKMVSADSTSPIRRDTIAGPRLIRKEATDSIRFFQAFHHVRIFSDSLQGVCDSLYYSAKDSVFRLYRDPLLWSIDNQISGDTIYLFTKNKKPDLLMVFENGFSINKTRQSFYNQIRGNRLNGFFKDGNIDYMRAKGNAESVYYMQDADSAYVGMNYAKADAISMYFAEKELKKVAWVNSVEGTTYPMGQIPEDKKKLRNFNWQESRRPKTKTELFGY
ncbi:OstA-like protein [Pollutibacter soli]|uniref:OstA-like protein n=1 Tax=Pollutibacter soli TaxID=3034157 RepID=UPI0030132A05